MNHTMNDNNTIYINTTTQTINDDYGEKHDNTVMIVMVVFAGFILFCIFCNRNDKRDREDMQARGLRAQKRLEIRVLG